MSIIPGLGLMPDEPTIAAVPSSRTFKLQPFWEYRFEVSFGSPGITVKVISGSAEKDGTELALGNPYRFTAMKSKVLTLQGCTIEVNGVVDEEWVVKDVLPSENIPNMHANIHFKLHDERIIAGQTGRHGPRILITGTPNSGKTTCVRTLAAYATRMGDQPLVVNLNPEEGMLTLPGTLSASVFATMMDVESRSKWGSTPSSGPSRIPPKLPIVHFYGNKSPEDDPALFREIVATMANSVSARFTADPNVKRSGLIIDTSGVDPRNKTILALLLHIISEFSVNTVIAIDSSRLEEELKTMLKGEMTSLHEEISVVGINKSKELPTRDEQWLLQERDAEIKEYFFGDSRMVLSPYTQQVAFDSLTIYKMPESKFSLESKALERVEPDIDMLHWTLAIMQASVKDPPEVVRSSLILGFVYVAQINDDIAKIKLLGPLPGRLGDNPMIWGKWPEPNVNLLG